MKKTLAAAALLVIGLLLGCEVRDIYDRGGDDKGETVSTQTLADGTIVTTIQTPMEVNGTNTTQVTVITTHPDGTAQTNVTYTGGTLILNGNLSNNYGGGAVLTLASSAGGGAFTLSDSGVITNGGVIRLLNPSFTTASGGSLAVGSSFSNVFGGLLVGPSLTNTFAASTTLYIATNNIGYPIVFTNGLLYGGGTLLLHGIPTNTTIIFNSQ